MRRVLVLLLPLSLGMPLAAQNFLPNGNFEQGLLGWTNTTFNDPVGKHGIGTADVKGTGPSQALFADFQTLTSVMSCTYVSAPFPMPAVTLDLSFDVMFQKQVTTPIPSVTVNRFEVSVLDSTSTVVHKAQVNAPNQTGLFERASYKMSFAVPAVGLYTVQVFMRHSNLAGIPFTAWIDNIVVGSATYTVFGSPCPGSGSIAPLIGAAGTPGLGSIDWKINVKSAFGPTVGLLNLGINNASWAGLPLPFDIGGQCGILVAPIYTVGAPLVGAGAGQGAGEVPLPIPNNPALQGAMLYGQWWVIDAGSGSWTGLALSAGIMFKIL